MDRAEVTDARRRLANPALVVLDGLIDELTEVIDSENALLAEGMPASLAGVTGRKSNLALRIQEDLAALGASGAIAGDDRAYFEERVALVQAKAKENLSRLAGAIGASRRRIAAVVAAVRESEAERPSTYGRPGVQTRSASMTRASLLPDQIA